MDFGTIPIFITVILILPVLLLVFSKWKFTYWKRRNLKQITPVFFYGNIEKLLKRQLSLGETFNEFYTNFRKDNLKHGGIYWMFEPQYVPTDPQVVKDLLTTDFNSFHGRGLYQHNNDVLSQGLFRMNGESWKQLRTKLTPTFTSSRMKMMFETLCEKNIGLKAVAEAGFQKGGSVDIKDISSRFTIDVIGSCAFGIEVDSLKEPNCDFRNYGTRISAPKVWRALLEGIVPWKILGYTGYKAFPSDIANFFRKVTKETVEYRTANNIYRKDFMHLLLQLRNRGVLSEDGNITKDAISAGILTDDEIVAQCFLFFGAGFDTSASTMTFALYELSRYPDIQDRMRHEIKDVLKKYGGQLTYEAAKEMVYTEKVIFETLRKYPSVPVLPRVCTRTYKVPNTGVTVEKGTVVQIPVWGLQMDPEYWPEPDVFDPERFNEENVSKRPEFTYLPFGEGPRMCIGMRFGILQAKVGLVGLLKDYSFVLDEKTPYPLTYKTATFLLQANENILLKISKVQDE